MSHAFTDALTTRRRFLQISAGAITAGLAAPFLAPESARAADRPLPRLDRKNLLIWRDADGQIHPVRNIDDWQKRRAMILEGMQQIMGPLPGPEKRTPLDMNVERETDDGTYVTRLITYSPEPGERIPAWLLVPRRALDGERCPGMLSPYGTGMTGTAFGKAALETEGFPRWGDHRDYARELAERGYVTLVPPYPHLGEYRPDLTALGYASGTMKAIWNNIRGLDLLDSLPYVRAGRYGSIGHSLGGHNSIYTGVFEERIVAVVSSCGFDSYLDYYDGDEAVWMPNRNWANLRYMPRLSEYRGRLEEIPVDFHEMIAALAPRAFFSNSPTGDSNFRYRSAARVVDTARQIYKLYGVPQRIGIVHPDAGHSFPDAVRHQSYEFLDRYVRT